MSTLKDKLDTLNPEQKRLLFYAFEHGISQFVMLNAKEFIGVNIKETKGIRITAQAGVWSNGEIVKGA